MEWHVSLYQHLYAKPPSFSLSLLLLTCIDRMQCARVKMVCVNESYYCWQAVASPLSNSGTTGSGGAWLELQRCLNLLQCGAATSLWCYKEREREALVDWSDEIVTPSRGNKEKWQVPTTAVSSGNRNRVYCVYNRLPCVRFRKSNPAAWTWRILQLPFSSFCLLRGPHLITPIWTPSSQPAQVSPALRVCVCVHVPLHLMRTALFFPLRLQVPGRADEVWPLLSHVTSSTTTLPSSASALEEGQPCTSSQTHLFLYSLPYLPDVGHWLKKNFLSDCVFTDRMKDSNSLLEPSVFGGEVQIKPKPVIPGCPPGPPGPPGPTGPEVRLYF